MSTETKEYQPKTGAPCHCRKGQERDNCGDCEGTGMQIDFKRIREATKKVTVVHSHKVAIRTKYFGSSNVKGSRVKADAGMKRTVTISYDHSLRSEDAHAKAAIALCEKMKWDGALLGGAFEDGGYAFIFTE